MNQQMVVFSRQSGFSVVLKKENTLYVLALVPALFYLGIAFVWPLVRLLLMSLAAPGLITNYVRIFTTPIYTRVIVQTLAMAGEVALLCLLLGYPLAYTMTRLRPQNVSIVVGLLLLPLWTSILVRSYAWIIILSASGFLNSMLLRLNLIRAPLDLIFNEVGVLIGVTHVLLPFAVLPLYSVMRGIDWNLVLAAQSLGANPARTFWVVYLPLSLPGVFAAVLLVFIQAVGFYITPAILGGGRVVVMAMLIERQVTELLNWEFASALAIVLLAITIVLLAVYQRLIGGLWSQSTAM